MLSAACITGAIEPSATIGARILLPSKIMAQRTSQKVNFEEGRLNAFELFDEGLDCTLAGVDIAARLLLE